MPANFQSSFIPKDPSSQETFLNEKPSMLTTIGLVIFVLTIFTAGGLFVYKMTLNSKNAELKSMLVESENSIDRGKINEILRFDRKLSYSKNLVMKHDIITNFLSDLSKNTAVSISFNDFNYGNLDNTGLAVTLKGTAPSYSSIAFQESVFLKNPNYKKVVFSNLRIGENGRVSFDVYLQVDPRIITYNIQNISTTTSALPTEEAQTTNDTNANEEADPVTLNTSFNGIN